MKRFSMAVCFAVLATSAALAQQEKTVPPAPTPADEGPELDLVYHLTAVAQTLRFTPEAISEIFLGKDDGRIATLNPGIRLPNKMIVVIHRREACQATLQWTTWLANESPNWRSSVGSGRVVPWPLGLEGRGIDGVISFLTRIDGSLSYLEAGAQLPPEIVRGSIVARGASADVAAAQNALPSSEQGPLAAQPPAPKPADEGPSLEVTMKFIQDKLNDIGPVIWVEYYHEAAKGDNWTNTFGEEIKEFVADSSACRISYRRISGNLTDAKIIGGKLPPGTSKYDIQVSLKDIADIVIIPELESEVRLHAAATNPDYRRQTPTNVAPPVFSLQVVTNHPITMVWVQKPEFQFDPIKRVEFKFLDDKMADRVARALQHATELCGAGSKPEPF